MIPKLMVAQDGISSVLELLKEWCYNWILSIWVNQHHI